MCFFVFLLFRTVPSAAASAAASAADFATASAATSASFIDFFLQSRSLNASTYSVSQASQWLRADRLP